MKKIIILGAGFGGLFAAKHLLQTCKPSDVEITLINKTNYFLFTPMLHEVATGGLNRHNIVEPIRDILKAKNFNFLLAHVEKVDCNKRIIITSAGNVRYDLLIIAIGATTNFYNTTGAEKYCLTLKDIKDATEIRDKIICSIEKASLVKDEQERKRLLTFIIVGGGPTGVEVAGEVAEFTKQIIDTRYKNLSKDLCKVMLLQRGPTILPGIHERCIFESMKALEKKGVIILTNSAATKVMEKGIEINNKQFIDSYNMIWTAGITPHAIETTPRATDEKGYFPVDQMFHVNNLKDIYAIGDCALFFNKGSSLPAMWTAQLASKQAKHLAQNIANKLIGKKELPFFYKPAGFLVSIGQKFGVADLKGFRFKGFLAWWLWRTIYLFKLVGTANKFRVAYEWTLNLFYKRDTTMID